MSAQLQRFCPLCDRAFVEGEAVLRCEGCGVLHHPACWVRNDGCVTQGDHRRSPVAQAYASQKPLAAQAPHPGEGMRWSSRGTHPLPAAPPFDDAIEGLEPVVAPPRPARPAPAREDITPEGPVIGEAPAAGDDPREFVRPRAPRRYEPPADGSAPHRPLPKLYGRHRLLAFWYVPVAVILAVAIAGGIIWAGDQLFGGESHPAGATLQPLPSPTESATVPGTQSPPAASSATPAVTASATAAGSPSATRVPGSKFGPGDVAIVTGAGDCLNVRVKPGRENDAIVCLPDGAEVTVRGGPQSAGGLTWWQVLTPLGEGWAAEDYLVAR